MDSNFKEWSQKLMLFVECSDMKSDYNMEFARHIQNLVMTDCYFQHCFCHTLIPTH